MNTGLGNLGTTQIAAMLLVVGIVVLVPVGMVVWVARWIARRNLRDRESPPAADRHTNG